MKLISECKNVEKGFKICREEEGKIICFENNEYELVCDVIEIEKCVLNKPDDGKRCDFLFFFNKANQEYQILKNNSLAYYVELKGIELETACEQLLNSIDKTMDQLNGVELNAIVVSSREFNPKYDNNEFYRRTRRLIKKNIHFEVTPYTVIL